VNKYIATIDLDLYRTKLPTIEIASNVVMITDKQLAHTKEKHTDFDYCDIDIYGKDILTAPDYIVPGNKPDTIVVMKEFNSPKKHLKMAVYVSTTPDNANQVMTAFNVTKKEWNRILKKNCIF
jgi:hypothetical protein